MTYEQLAGKMGALLDDLEKFIEDTGMDTDFISSGNKNRLLLAPNMIWDNVINELQEIIDNYRE